MFFSLYSLDMFFDKPVCQCLSYFKEQLHRLSYQFGWDVYTIISYLNLDLEIIFYTNHCNNIGICFHIGLDARFQIYHALVHKSNLTKDFYD